jgi:ATP synthase subunit 6
MYSIFDQFEFVYFCRHSNMVIYGYMELFFGLLLINSLLQVDKKIINDTIVSWFFTGFAMFMTIFHYSYKNGIAWNITYKNKEVNPYFKLFSVFWFVFLANMLGMVPYTYTITSQLIIAMGLSFYYFFGLNLSKIKQQKLSFFSRFVPTGISFILVPYLVPIETLSFLFRGVSLGVRLFANITAGHILLKVLMGFFWIFISSLSIVSKIVGLLILPINIGIMGMEFVMGFLQAFVFVNLLHFYIQDSSIRYFG